MGMFDNLKKKATKAVDQHGDKIATGIDKAARPGRQEDRAASTAARSTRAPRAAKDALDKLDGRDDDIPNDPKPTPRRQAGRRAT